MAADLLLARCPEAYRGVWPEDVVRALDHPAVVSPDGEQGPWSDAHVERAIVLAGEDTALVEEIQRWWHRLKRLRREFRPSSSMSFRTPTPHTCACWLDCGGRVIERKMSQVAHRACGTRRCAWSAT